MKNSILLLCVIVNGCNDVVSQSSCGNRYFEHKSLQEIAAMTPEQKMDQMVLEQMFHAPWDNDENHELLHRYLVENGPEILPTAIKFITEFDPAVAECRERNRTRLFTAAMYLSNIDNAKFRIRSTEHGTLAIIELEKAIERRRKAMPDPEAHDSRKNLLALFLEGLVGRTIKDGFIKETLKERYKIELSEAELVEFSDFLTLLDPTYPSWTHIWNTTVPGAPGMTTTESERFHQAYRMFKEKR